MSEVVEGINETLQIFQASEMRVGSNLAPTESVSAVTFVDGRLTAGRFRWGLIPSWSRRDPSTERPLINARIETVQEKPSFRESFLKRRAILPANGFIEWRREPSGRKVPYKLVPSSGENFGLVAIWDRWRSPHGEMVESAAVLTREASQEFKVIHHRLPVMLKIADWQAYLRGTLSRPSEILAAADALSHLDASQIGNRINRPGNQDFRLIESEGRIQTIRTS